MKPAFQEPVSSNSHSSNKGRAKPRFALNLSLDDMTRAWASWGYEYRLIQHELLSCFQLKILNTKRLNDSESIWKKASLFCGQLAFIPVCNMTAASPDWNVDYWCWCLPSHKSFFWLGRICLHSSSSFPSGTYLGRSMWHIYTARVMVFGHMIHSSVYVGSCVLSVQVHVCGGQRTSGFIH